mgnify:FL=1
MKLIDLLNGVDVKTWACELDREIRDLCYDSRKVQPGDVFVAIRGYQTDGHKYIDQAVEKGAAAVVCETPPSGAIPYVQVDDSRRALAQMSNHYFGHPAESMTMVGVTGTNGKTTTTFLIRSVLEQVTGKKVGLMGTNVNIVGDREFPAQRTTPESYEVFQLLAQMREAGCAYAVMEVSSHSLELDRVYGIEFDAAVFTNLSRDHLDFHQTMERYQAAKAKLFRMARWGLVNLDDPAGKTMMEQGTCTFQTYSAKDDNADLVAKNINLKPDRVEFEAVGKGIIHRISLGIPGMFSVYNALAATSCCMALGLALPEIAAALKNAHGVKGRAEVVPVPADFTVLIDYAHSPDGMENILKAVKGFAKGRVVALFGCGGDRDRTKRPIMGEVAARLADFCIVTSDNPRSEDPRAIIEEILPGMKRSKTPMAVIDDRRAAIVYALENARPGDVVVLMGKGHETYQEIQGVKHHLDEREEVANYFAKQEG